jgi:ATP-binding cassette subfamily C protein
LRILSYFFQRYPGETLRMAICLLLGTVAEGIGISTLLPLLRLAAEDPGSSRAEPTQLEHMVQGLLGGLGLEPTIGVLLTLLVLTAFIQAGLVILSKVQVGFTVAHVATDLRLSLLRALLRARWAYYTRQPIGAAANAMATEADRGATAFHFLAQVVALVIQALLYIGLALVVSWRATIASVAAGLATVQALSFLVHLAERAGRRQTELLKSLLARLVDSLQAAKLLKATGRESLIGPLLQQDTRRLEQQLRRRVFSTEALMALQDPIIVLFLAIGIYVALTRFEMALNALLVLVLLFWQALLAISKIQRRWQSTVTEASALWSLREMIERAEAVEEPPTGTGLPSVEHGIALDGVRVEYDGRTILDSISLEAPARQITAIVGASGSGKTTILDLITGLVSPTTGAVRVDGVPLAELDRERWRAGIGYVPQEVFLLHDTVRTNITLGDPSMDGASVERALRDAGAWEFVSNLPQGLETVVGERGSLLSGGQRQRIAIARALMRGPRLLLLDEATAALDAESETAVWEATRRLRGRVTVIAISHQPALLAIADRAYRLEAGTVELVPQIATMGMSPE